MGAERCGSCLPCEAAFAEPLGVPGRHRDLLPGARQQYVADEGCSARLTQPLRERRAAQARSRQLHRVVLGAASPLMRSAMSVGACRQASLPQRGTPMASVFWSRRRSIASSPGGALNALRAQQWRQPQGCEARSGAALALSQQMPPTRIKRMIVNSTGHPDLHRPCLRIRRICGAYGAYRVQRESPAVLRLVRRRFMHDCMRGDAGRLTWADWLRACDSTLPADDRWRWPTFV